MTTQTTPPAQPRASQPPSWLPLLALAVAAAAACACQAKDPAVDSATTTASATVASDSVSTTASASTSTSTTASGTTTSTEAETATTSSADPSCSIYDDECPEGEKCMPVHEPGLGVENRCVPLARDPNSVGEPCEYLGPHGTGLDSCEKGAWCLENPLVLNQAECVSFCAGSPERPTCPQNGVECQQIIGSHNDSCLADCWPTNATCGDSSACVEDNQGEFHCADDISGENGQFGDPCAVPADCDPGLACRLGEAVPGCISPKCCTPFCLLDDPYTTDLAHDATKCPNDSMLCRNWYTQDAPPWLSWTGVCEL